MIPENVLREFVTADSPYFFSFGMLLNLVLAALLSYLLGRIYTKYGQSMSNRRKFSDNFILLAITTTIIITIIKSSLALSLGLVGALSVIRFRSAIKEPEELIFLFIAIAIGLGLGANMRLLTTLGFFFLALVVYVLSLRKEKSTADSVHIIVEFPTGSTVKPEEVIAILEASSQSVKTLRIEQNEELMQLVFSIEGTNDRQLIRIKEAIYQKLQPSAFTYLNAA